MNNNEVISKESWVILFRDIGLDDETMKKWHQSFEKRYSDSHQAFLKWLNIPDIVTFL